MQCGLSRIRGVPPAKVQRLLVLQFSSKTGASRACNEERVGGSANARKARLAPEIHQATIIYLWLPGYEIPPDSRRFYLRTGAESLDTARMETRVKHD